MKSEFKTDETSRTNTLYLESGNKIENFCFIHRQKPEESIHNTCSSRVTARRLYLEKSIINKY